MANLHNRHVWLLLFGVEVGCGSVDQSSHNFTKYTVGKDIAEVWFNWF